MFADFWEEIPENDDHLPLEERGWYKRLMERVAAHERFEREHPDLLERIGRAMAQEKQELAIKILAEDR